MTFQTKGSARRKLFPPGIPCWVEFLKARPGPTGPGPALVFGRRSYADMHAGHAKMAPICRKLGVASSFKRTTEIGLRYMEKFVFGFCSTWAVDPDYLRASPRGHPGRATRPVSRGPEGAHQALRCKQRSTRSTHNGTCSRDSDAAAAAPVHATTAHLTL